MLSAPVAKKRRIRPTSVCPRCEGSGWITVDADGGSVRVCECRRVRDTGHLVDAAGIPARYDRCSLENFDVSTHPSGPGRDQLARAVSLCRQYVDGFLSEEPGRRTIDGGLLFSGSPGAGKTHLAIGLGLAACQKGMTVGFVTAAGLVNQLTEARDEKRLMRLQTSLAKLQLLIIDELGYVPLSQTGAELLFEIISQRYERGSTVVTSNLAFEDWTSVFGSERLTGALLDRLTHHVHILEMNGDSYRLKQSKARKASQAD